MAHSYASAPSAEGATARPGTATGHAVGPGEEGAAAVDPQRAGGDRVDAADGHGNRAREAGGHRLPCRAVRPGEEREAGAEEVERGTGPAAVGSQTCGMRPPRSTVGAWSAPLAVPSGSAERAVLCSTTGRRSRS